MNAGQAPRSIHGLLLGMALLWGLSWPAGRVLALALPPLSVSAWRFALAGVVLLAWMRWKVGHWPHLSRSQWLGLVATGAVGVFGYSVCFMYAVRLVEAGRAAVVVTTNPVFISVLAAWLFHEPFNRRIGLGLGLAVLGASLVMTHGAPWRLFTGEVGQGEWLLLGCVAAWAAYSLMGKRLMVGIDALVATAITASVGGVMLVALAAWVDGPALLWRTGTDLTPTLAANLLFMALGPTVLAYAWFYRGMEVLGAGVASRYISLVPVFGVAGAVVFLGEPLDWPLWVGGAVALGGVVLANQGRSAPASK